MIVVLTGAPGAGKGTQADRLAEELGFVKISTGDALRNQIKIGTKVGIEASGFMKEGKLVPDGVLLDILKAELEIVRGEKVLLDGYPRNLAQAKTLETMSNDFPVDKAILIDVSQSLLVDRICGRRVCESCGSGFHVNFSQPKVEGVCDKCDGRLVQRPDDTEDKVRTRLEIYEKQTIPVLDYYKSQDKYQRVDGDGSMEEVFSRISEIIT